MFSARGARTVGLLAIATAALAILVGSPWTVDVAGAQDEPIVGLDGKPIDEPLVGLDGKPIEPPSVAVEAAPVEAPATPTEAQVGGQFSTPSVTPPRPPDTPSVTETGDATGADDAVSIVVVLTVLAVVPTVLVLATSFTRILIVLSLTRNALGLQGVPPNQVLIGLSLFLTLFVMGPAVSQANDESLQPFLAGEIEQSEAFEKGIEPFRVFMLDQVREKDLSLFVDMSGLEEPETPEDVPLTTLIPAFLVGELRAAFIIGFVIFVPFLVVDLLTSATLMSMGMVMLPPVVISLPFKLLLFVMIDGWALLVPTLVGTFEI
ncbi:MAG: flagellar type III secretion system pore protein FliP [Acidimicrobiales bacterium]